MGGTRNAGTDGRHAQDSAAVPLAQDSAAAEVALGSTALSASVRKLRFIGRCKKAIAVAAEAEPESFPGADFADGSLFTKEGSQLLSQLQRDVRRQTGCGADSADPLLPPLPLTRRHVDSLRLHDEHRKKRHDCRGPHSGRHAVASRSDLAAPRLPCIADSSCMTARSVHGQPPVKIDYLMKCRCTKRRCCNMCRLVFKDKKEGVAVSQSRQN